MHTAPRDGTALQQRQYWSPPTSGVSVLVPTSSAASGLSRQKQALPAVSVPSKPHWQHVHLASSGVAAVGQGVHDTSRSALVQRWVLQRGAVALRTSLRGHGASVPLQHSIPQT